VSLSVLDQARRVSGSAGQRWVRSGIGRRILLVAGGGIVAVFLVAAIAPQLFTHASPVNLYAGNPLSPPSTGHWLGTDELGRDFFARVVYGTRASLTMAVLVVAIGASVGVVVGVVSGMAGGWLDEILMRVVDLFLSLPGFILALALSAALGRGEPSVVIALSIVWWPSYARLVRGMILSMKHRLHVESARALGASPFRIARRHILPFLWGQMNARITQDMGYALVSVAGLGFLGLGAQPPTPEWGSLLESGLQYVVNGWWLTVFPGLAITLWTLGVAMLGDGLSGFARSEQGARR
jgi:peptide/nickel transport system permease protein